jgi:hypothetical protein
VHATTKELAFLISADKIFRVSNLNLVTAYADRIAKAAENCHVFRIWLEILVRIAKSHNPSFLIREWNKALLPSVWVTLGRFSDFREHAGEHLEA